MPNLLFIRFILLVLMNQNSAGPSKSAQFFAIMESLSLFVLLKDIVTRLLMFKLESYVLTSPFYDTLTPNCVKDVLLADLLNEVLFIQKRKEKAVLILITDT